MNRKQDLDKPFSELCSISEMQKTFQGNITWNIPNHKIKSYGDLCWKKQRERSIESSSFSIGSPLYCSFHLEIYLNNNRNIGIRTIFLNKFPDSAWVKIEMNFQSIDVHKTFRLKGEAFQKKITFRFMNFDNLFSYKSLQDFLSKSDSDFIIECSVKISIRDIKCAFDKEKVCYAESRNYDLNRETFKQESLFDVQIDVNGHLFKTHKSLLAQVPYFQELFDTHESKNHFEITDIDHEIFNHILTFLHLRNIPRLCFKLACDLYIVASDLKIFDLKCLCSSYLGANLTESNVVIVLKLSHEYDDADLKTQCFQFIKKADAKMLTEKSIVL